MIANFIQNLLRQVIDFLYSCSFTIGGVKVSYGHLFFFSIAFLIGCRIVHVVLNRYEDNY